MPRAKTVPPKDLRKFEMWLQKQMKRSRKNAQIMLERMMGIPELEHDVILEDGAEIAFGLALARFRQMMEPYRYPNWVKEPGRRGRKPAT